MQATEQAEQAKLTANDAATAAQNASDAAQSGKTAASRATDAADASKDAAVNSLEAVQGIGELIKMVRSLLTGGTFERPSSPTEQAIVEDLIAAKVITCEAVMCTVSKERSIIEMAITSEITAIDGAAAVGKVIQQLELLPELQTAAITTNKRLQGGIFKKCVNSQAVYPLSEQHGLEAQKRR